MVSVLVSQITLVSVSLAHNQSVSFHAISRSAILATLCVRIHCNSLDTPTMMIAVICIQMTPSKHNIYSTINLFTSTAASSGGCLMKKNHTGVSQTGGLHAIKRQNVWNSQADVKSESCVSIKFTCLGASHVCMRELICVDCGCAVAIILPEPHSLPHQVLCSRVIALVTHLGAMYAPCMRQLSLVLGQRLISSAAFYCSLCVKIIDFCSVAGEGCLYISSARNVQQCVQCIL